MGDARVNRPVCVSDWSKSHQGRFQKLLETGFLSDLQITVGDKVFRVHKLMLATGSPILHEKICQAPSYKVGKYSMKEDVQPEIFHAFLKFIYTGVTCDLSVEQALPLLQLAVAYQVHDLEEKCYSLLNEDLTDETAIQIYQQAVHYRDDEMLVKALRYVCRNAWSIIESDQFVDLTLDNLKRLLLSEKLLVLNETQLVRGLFRWSKKECERNKGDTSSNMVVSAIMGRWINWDLVDPDKFEEPDIIDLEKLFNAYYTLEDITPKRQCKFSRKYFEDDDSSYLISRFPQKFAYCTDNKSCNPEVIKFKTDVAICLLSIGIPAYSQTCEDFINAKLEIYEDSTSSDSAKQKLAVIAEKVPHSTEMVHLRFPQPYKIRKGTWYTVAGTITGTPGYGNMGGKSIHTIKCNYPNGSEINVKFEFKSYGSDNISGGQIDEFAFKLVET